MMLNADSLVEASRAEFTDAGHSHLLVAGRLFGRGVARLRDPDSERRC
jgi:hypothetical protein